MATKNNPGAFDEYAALGSDEPYAILRASSLVDAEILRIRAARKRELGDLSLKMEDDSKCADEMEIWRSQNVKTASANEVLLSAARQLHQAHSAGIAFEVCLEPICVVRRKALADIEGLKP